MPSYVNKTLAELDQQLDLLDTFDEIGTALTEYSGNLATYSAADLESHLSEALRAADDDMDTSVDWLLGKLKDALTSVEAIGRPYEKLTSGAGLAGDVASHYNTVEDMIGAIVRAETLSGTEKADVLKQIVDGMPGLASALTGLGGLNPVIGTFLTLYGKAIESAAVVIGMIEARHDDQVALIQSKGEIDVDALLAEQQAAEEAAETSRQALIDQYNEVLDAWIDKKLARDRTNYKIAARYCVHRNAEVVREALSVASRHQTTEGGRGIALQGKPSVNETDLSDLESWIKGIEGDIAGANLAGAAARARELSGLKYRVADLLKDVKDCIKERLEWMELHGAGSWTRRRRVWLGAGGALGAMAVGIGLWVWLSDDGTVTVPSVATETTVATEATPTTVTVTSNAASQQTRLSPLLINPCDVVTAEAIEAFAANPVTLWANDFVPGPDFDPEESRRAVCQYTADTATGFGIWMEVQRGERDFFTNFQDRYSDALSVNEAIGFGEYGELRVMRESKNVTGTPHEGTAVALQVHYQGGNQVSGLFILVVSQPSPDDAPYASTEAQESTVRNIAKLLWDALVAAQE